MIFFSSNPSTSMLTNSQVIFQVKRYRKTDVYISTSELQDLFKHLSPSEINFYNVIKGSVLKNPTADYYMVDSLAVEFNTSKKTISNMKSSLKKKGYLIIESHKDNRGNTIVKVIIGKEQVELYNLGLDISITDAKAYRELIKLFPINDTSLTIDARKELVRQANEHYLTTTK